MIIKGYVFVYLYLFGILGLTGLLKKVFNISDNSSRKVVHVMVSFSWVIMYKYLFALLIIHSLAAFARDNNKKVKTFNEFYCKI